MCYGVCGMLYKLLFKKFFTQPSEEMSKPTPTIPPQKTNPAPYSSLFAAEYWKYYDSATREERMMQEEYLEKYFQELTVAKLEREGL
jgi:hypothetical protein